MKKTGKFISFLLIIALLCLPLSCVTASAEKSVSEQGCVLSSGNGAAVRIDTVKYTDSGTAVYSGDIRFRAKLVVPADVNVVEFGYVYTLSQYLNNNVKPKYNELEDTLSSSEGYVLEKDMDYGYSSGSKSQTLVVYDAQRPQEENGNYYQRTNSSTGETLYTFNLVINVLKKWFTGHAFVTRPYYVYLNSEGERVTVYGYMYSRCLQYVAYTAYYAKDSNGKYVESNDSRVTLAEILGYRDPGHSGWY